MYLKMEAVIFILVLTTITYFSEVDSLNILGIFPHEGKSHFFVFRPLLLDLARRGHNLTIISHFPEKSPPDNYHDISLAGKSKLLEDVFSIERSYSSIIKIPLLLVQFGTENCKLILADENVQNLWKSNAKFDLVLVEEFNSDCGKGLAYRLDAPVVALTSHVPMPWYFRRMGMAYNPSYMSFMFLEGGTKPTLYQRIERSIFYTYVNILYTYFCQRVDEKTLAQYFDNIPPLEELGRQTKFTLVYQYLALHGSTLTPSNFIEVGGYHVAEPKVLPDGDLKKFIEESDHGVIYISFGSMLRAASTSVEVIQIIIDAMSALPHRVVWKWEEPTLPGNPKNIYVAKWLPQNDILAHPKVHAFYSHCGLLGTTEAIYHGVPIVGMPIFGDQPANAAAVEESGLGVQIQIQDLSVKNLLSKFKTVLDPKFKENVKRLSRMWHDRPMTPMNTAIYWIEFAARHPDLNLRTKAADVPYYQFLCLDVLSVLAIIIIVLIFVIKIVVKSTRKSKTQANKTKKKD